MNVFDLAATLTLDSKGFNKGMKEAQSTASGVASKIGSGLKTAGKVGAAAFGAIAGVATVAGKKLYDNINQVADYGDKVDKMSQKIGMSAENYQKWDYVMQRAGGSVDSLKMGMKTLSVQAQKNSESFQKLGISQDKVKSLNQEQLFEETVKGLSKMEAGTQRTKLATELLGRAGADLGPLLNQGSKSIEQQMKIAEDYGMVMSDKAVKASADFKDSLTTLSMTAQGLKNRFMGEFLPSVTSVTDGLAKLFTGDVSGLEQINKGIEGIINRFSNILPKIVKIGGSIVMSLFNSILKNAPKLLTSLTKFILSEAPKILNALLSAVVALGNGLVEGLPKLIPQLINSAINIIITALNNIDDIVNLAVNLINGFISGILQALPILISKLPEIIQKIISAVLGAIPILINGAIQLVMMLVQNLPTIIQSLIKALPTIIKSVVSGLISALPQLINGAIKLIIMLVENLPTIIIALIEAIPQIIESIIDGFLNNLPALIKGCILLVIGIVKALPQIILKLIQAIPRIVKSIVSAFLKLGGKFIEIGKNLVKGIWDGIVGMGSWLWDKISGFFGGIVDNVKKFFGIHSPSTLMRDKIGKMLARGVGIGFVDEMKNVSKQMQSVIPTDFDLYEPDYEMFSTGDNKNALANQNFNLTINNPVVRKDEDIKAISDQISESLGQMFRQRSVAYG